MPATTTASRCWPPPAIRDVPPARTSTRCPPQTCQIRRFATSTPPVRESPRVTQVRPDTRTTAPTLSDTEDGNATLSECAVRATTLPKLSLLQIVQVAAAAVRLRHLAATSHQTPETAQQTA